MSLLSRIYGASPVVLQNAALSAYGALLRRRRYGGEHDRVLRALELSQWKSAEELGAMQLADLNKTLSAAREVPMYRERQLPPALSRLDELCSLPFLHKNDLRQPRERVVSVSPSVRLLSIHTGGTTGTPLSIYCNRAVLQRNFAFFERFRAWTGAKEGSRVATFAGRAIIPPLQTKPPFWRRNFASNAMLFSSYHISANTLPDYVNALINFGPEIIDSYPSNLELIARYMVENGVTGVRPKGVITSSETLRPSVRASIEAAFRCPVFDHYGGGEMAALITQCEHGSYHVNSEFGIVEIIRDGRPAVAGESGEIVATGFINHVMPLIRYRTGDMATVGSAQCACGRAMPTVERIEGRMDDFITTPEGYMVGRLDPIFKSVDSILETRLVQDAPDHVRIELVPGAAYMPDQGTVLVEELRKRVGSSMRIDIVLLSSIPRTARGKLRMVVNETLRREDTEARREK